MAAPDRVNRSAIHQNPGDAVGGPDCVIAKERGPSLLNEFLIDWTDRRLIASPALARAFALFLKFRFEAVHIKPHRFFVGDFFSEIERKSIGVVELENFDTGNDIFA